MPRSAVSVLVVAQSSSEIPEGLMNNPVFWKESFTILLGAMHGLVMYNRLSVCLSVRDLESAIKPSDILF